MNYKFSKNFKFDWLILPYALVFFIFFIIPLLLVIIVGFWDYNEYAIIPDFILMNYEEIFEGYAI